MTLVLDYVLKSYYFAAIGEKYIINFTCFFLTFNMAIKSSRITYVTCVIFLLDNTAL